jgi:hypothetical protein
MPHHSQSPKAMAGTANNVVKRINFRDISKSRSRSASEPSGTMAKFTKILGK